MERSMLFEAAREGKVEVLERLLQENPSILADIRLTSFAESVLHVATKFSQLNFVHELMKTDPDIAGEMNKDGFRPLDIAVIIGNLEIVRTILSFNRDLGRLAGKDSRTALHYAAVKGRVEIIDELLSTCPDGIEDITVHGETALHVALKHYQFNVFYALVKWLERLSKESIINIQDGDGNTVLHLAVSTKQYACLNLVLDENSSIRGTIEVNVLNGKGLTALDISDMVIQDCYDAKIKETLQRASAIRAQDSTTITAQYSPQLETNSRQPIHDHFQSEPPSRNWLKYFKFQRQRDSPSDARNTLLVVAALITTVTFQAAVNPPSGLFDESRRLINSTNIQPSHKQPIRVAFTLDFMFVFFNSLGFTASSLIITYLTTGFPLYREIFTSLSSMCITYSIAISINVAGTKAEAKIRDMSWYITVVALFLPHFMRWPPTFLMKEAWGCWGSRADRNTGLPIVN